MKCSATLLVTLFLAGTLSASPFDSGVVVGWNERGNQAMVARGGAAPTIGAFGGEGKDLLWSIEGPAEPAAIVFSEDGTRAAILDTLHDIVFLVSTKDGSSKRVPTKSSPIAALFHLDQLFVLCRDGRELQRISADGKVTSTPVPPDTAFLRAINDRLYLYSRLEGTITEVDPRSLNAVRSTSFAAAASDFEVDEQYGYLVLPARGEIIVISLSGMRERERLTVGAIPTDLSIAGDGGLLNPGALATADPSSKRIWMSERSQSGAAALGRGFMRGFLGLGLYAPKSSEYPTGVDRVWTAAWGMAAHDSSTGTLYLVRKGKGVAIGTGIPADAIAMTSRGVAFWNVRSQRLELKDPASIPVLSSEF